MEKLLKIIYPKHKNTTDIIFKYNYVTIATTSWKQYEMIKDELQNR